MKPRTRECFIASTFLLFLMTSVQAREITSNLPDCPKKELSKFDECYGTRIGKDKTEYSGEWKNDKFHGRGKLWFGYGDFLGDFYEGEFVDGAMHGYGKYTFVNGDSITGNWTHHKKHGEFT